MIRYLTLIEVLELHRRILGQSGGASGIRDIGLLESAIAQPRMTYGQQDLYPSLLKKAAALEYSMIMNHPFVDGNKRIGHAVMEIFLIFNGMEIDALVEEQEQLILAIAAGMLGRERLVEWLKQNTVPCSSADLET